MSPLLIILLCGVFVGLMFEKGLLVALSYAVLLCGLAFSTVCLRVAYELWRPPRKR